MRNSAWVSWSLILWGSALLHRAAFTEELGGFLVDVKGRGVVLAQATSPVAPGDRQRNSIHQLAMGRQISLNRSTVEQLQTVPHIGPIRAARIVRNRRENGNFLSIGALQRVHGIGPKTVQRVAQYLTL